MTDGRPLLEMQLAASLAGHGLQLRGWFTIGQSDIPPGVGDVVPGATALLVGNHGPAMWSAFSASPEHGDGRADPLDRWTRRVILAAVAELPTPARALFPFGPELWPFQRFAMRAMGLKPSPLGLLIDPQFGLWHALRAVVVAPSAGAPQPDIHNVIHPCDDCVEKPCLSACPVSAFTASGFAVASCRAYLDAPPSSQNDSTAPDCMNGGCAARNACPVGRDWRYDQAQIRFHMAAFRG